MAKSDRDSYTYGWILRVECVAVNWVVVGGRGIDGGAPPCILILVFPKICDYLSTFF